MSSMAFAAVPCRADLGVRTQRPLLDAAQFSSYNGDSKQLALPALFPVLKEVTTGAVTMFLVANVLGSSPDIAYALDVNNAQKIFQRSCIGCHVAGGNILQPGATLEASDLQRNGVASVDEIFRITYSGKGRMPGFGEQCAPRGQCTFGPRLSDEDIRSLAEFVRSQADKGWVDAK